MKFRSIHFLLATCLLIAPASAQKVPTSEEEHPDRDTFEKQSASYPEMPPCNFADALAVRLENNQLSVMTRLGSTTGPTRLKIKDSTAAYTANIRPAGDIPRGMFYTPDMFMLERWDFTQKNTTTSTTVQVTGWNTQIAEVIETSAGDLKQISLIQTPPDFSDGNVGIRLRVTVQAGAADAPSVNIERSAANFVALRRQYPIEFGTYVEPIFRDLRIDSSVFGPEAKLAWQVFASDVQIPNGLEANVNQIVARLDANRFHDREVAAADLQKLGQPAAMVLARMNRSHLSPEQNSRIEAFLSGYQLVSPEEATRMGTDLNFLIDCLYGNDDFIVTTALARLQKVTGKTITFDKRTTGDSRQEAIAKLRASLTPATTQPSAD